MGGKLFIKKLKFGQFCSRRCFRRASQELIFSSDFYKCTGFLNSVKTAAMTVAVVAGEVGRFFLDFS